MKKNGVFLFVISHLVPEIFKIFVLCKLGTDDVIRCDNMEDKIENISASNNAMKLKLGEHVIVRTLSCHCPVKLLTQYQPCIIVCYSVYFWLIRSFTDPAFTGSIFVCGPLHHHVLLSSIFWGRRSFQIRYAAHFLHGLAMIFLRDSLFLSADSLTPQ